MSISDTVQRPRAPMSEPAGDVAAAGPRGWLATLLDAVIALLALLLVPALLWIGLRPVWAWTIAILIGAAAAAAMTADLCRTGRSPGRRLLAVRTVATATGLPPAPGALFGRQLLHADLRVGRDPLRLVPAGAQPLAPAVRGGWRTTRARGPWRLLVDDGTRIDIAGSTLLGRTPTAEPGALHDLVAIPDLTRSISRVHALIEPGPDLLWLTDVGATNGTRVTEPSPSGGTVIERWVRPGAAVPVRAGGTIHLGDRTLLVTRSIPGA